MDLTAPKALRLMKRCPQCNSLFLDEENFCEIDGTELNSETDDEPGVSLPRPVAPRATSHQSVQIILIVAVVIFGGLVVFGYLALTRQRDPTNESSLSSSGARPQILSTPTPAIRG